MNNQSLNKDQIGRSIHQRIDTYLESLTDDTIQINHGLELHILALEASC